MQDTTTNPSTTTSPTHGSQDDLFTSQPSGNHIAASGSPGNAINAASIATGYTSPPQSPNPPSAMATSLTASDPSNSLPLSQLSLSDQQSSMTIVEDLTPIRAHYLKKTLVDLQFKKEIEFLSNPPPNATGSVLSYIGSPFTPPPKDKAELAAQLPFARFVFRQFVLSFPFLADAPKDFFPQKLQPFVDSLIARNLSASSIAFTADDPQDDVAATARRGAGMLGKVEKPLGILLRSAIKLVEKEDVVRLSQKDLDRLEQLAKKSAARRRRHGEKFEVNIVGVRTVKEKRHVRTRPHDEFIIRTRREGFKDIYVARRAGDFKTLADTLRKAHPEEEVRPPPAKDRSAKTTTTGYLGLGPGETTPISPLSTDGADTASNSSTTNLSFQQVNLSREKNRLTLRSYLHALLQSPVLASSPVLRSFLTADPIQLTTDELEDAHHREEADKVREEGRIRFDNEVKDRVEKLRESIKTLKVDMMGPDGLRTIFSTIRQTPEARSLPPEYYAVLEWGKISLASTLFHHLIATDSASETFSSVKRLHGMMPYFVLKGILRVSNPVAMIRGVLELFTAQPFGGKSLLQRMFTSSLTEELRAVQEDIELLSERIEDPVLCQKIRQYVYAPKEIQAIYRMDAREEKMNLITILLRSAEYPQLNRGQMQRVAVASKAHALYMKHRETLDDSDDDSGPEDENAWLYEDLQLLMRLYAKYRDLEQLIELIFEGTTADLLKDIITIFYAPLAEVYKAASIADSLGDFQNFVTDLIRTVEQVEDVSQEKPEQAVQAFVDLVNRHEQAFYNFIHKVQTKGEHLFDSLMKWIELFLTFMRDGIGESLSLEFVLPHTGQERAAILKEVDAVALYHYKLKVSHEEKVRRKFGRDGRGQGASAAEDEAAQALVDGVVANMSIGELLQGDVEAMGDDEDDDDDSSEYYTSSEEETTTEEETSSEEKPIEKPVKVAPATARPQPTMTPHQKSNMSSNSKSSNSSSENHLRAASNGSTASSVNGIKKRRTLDGLRGMFGGRSSTEEVPPVPPLPQSVRPAPPRSPMAHPPPKSKLKRKGVSVIKEPELKAIPELLPIFLEMVKPNLRPRIMS